MIIKPFAKEPYISGDFIDIPEFNIETSYESPDAIPFIYYDEQLYLGDYTEIHNDILKLYNGLKTAMGRIDGRLWIQQKYFSVWNETPIDYRILNDIKSKLLHDNINISDFKIFESVIDSHNNGFVISMNVSEYIFNRLNDKFFTVNNIQSIYEYSQQRNRIKQKEQNRNIWRHYEHIEEESQ